MAFSVTVTERGKSKNIDLNFAIPSPLSTSATSSTVNISGLTGVPDGTLQEVLEYLADQDFRSTGTPTGDNIAEGDTWYDTDNDQHYVYRETSSGVFQWVPIILGDTDSDTLDSGTF